MPLVEDFDALIDNEPFFDQPKKSKEKRMKRSSECQEMMTLQQEIY